MRRELAVLLAGAALIPATALAVATPDPTTMKDALAGPSASGYVEADPGTTGEGSFDAASYANTFISDASKRPAIERTLNADHFVVGYSRVWAKTGGGQALVEQILAFNDKSGATSYFHTSKLGDLSSTAYSGTVDTTAIPDSYGVRDAISGSDVVAVVFVKGNDVFGVVIASAKDYPTSETLSQAQTVYTAAPDYTIQPSANSSAGTSAYEMGRLAGEITIGLAVIGVILLAVGLAIRRRRRPTPQLADAPASVQMSADGRYWWDGATWQDSNLSAPAQAQRSTDGAFWWDGTTWHPVPRNP